MSDLPEKVIVSKGCHDCVFSERNEFFQSWCTRLKCFTTQYSDKSERHPQCPLNTHSIKVVKPDT